MKQLQASADQNKALYETAMNGVDAHLLDSFPNPALFGNQNIKLTLDIRTNEFTSLCPITGQPDFAEIVIQYAPDQLCVESKSLKLYFLSYRNHKGFHEECVNRICRDLVDLLHPLELKVIGNFTPRGGIPFHPTAEFIKSI
jgi:7-cyano-7-deazaguanine reductase